MLSMKWNRGIRKYLPAGRKIQKGYNNELVRLTTAWNRRYRCAQSRSQQELKAHQISSAQMPSNRAAHAETVMLSKAERNDC